MSIIFAVGCLYVRCRRRGKQMGDGAPRKRKSDSDWGVYGQAWIMEVVVYLCCEIDNASRFIAACLWCILYSILHTVYARRESRREGCTSRASPRHRPNNDLGVAQHNTFQPDNEERNELSAFEPRNLERGNPIENKSKPFHNSVVCCGAV